MELHRRGSAINRATHLEKLHVGNVKFRSIFKLGNLLIIYFRIGYTNDFSFFFSFFMSRANISSISGGRDYRAMIRFGGGIGEQ